VTTTTYLALQPARGHGAFQRLAAGLGRRISFDGAYQLGPASADQDGPVGQDEDREDEPAHKARGRAAPATVLDTPPWTSLPDTVDNEGGDLLVAPRLPLSDGVPGLAAPAVKALLDEQMLDQMVAQVRADGGQLTGPGSLLSELCKSLRRDQIDRNFDRLRWSYVDRDVKVDRNRGTASESPQRRAKTARGKDRRVDPTRDFLQVLDRVH
jgi:hypothetical protein